MATAAHSTTDITLDQAIDSLGTHLSGQAFAAPARFSFRWAGFRFRGTLKSLASGENELALTARLGLLPFSAEDAAARGDVMQALTQHLANLDGTYRITGQGEIQCVATTVFDGPVRAGSVAQCLTISLLHLRGLLGRFQGLLVPVA